MTPLARTSRLLSTSLLSRECRASRQLHRSCLVGPRCRPWTAIEEILESVLSVRRVGHLLEQSLSLARVVRAFPFRHNNSGDAVPYDVGGGPSRIRETVDAEQQHDPRHGYLVH